jgi:threonine/homoserine/homoserine lactone efflux protein
MGQGMSKKLFFAVFSVIAVCGISFLVTDSVIASAAIGAVSTIALMYLGGQSGVDAMGKYKGNP